MRVTRRPLEDAERRRLGKLAGFSANSDLGGVLTFFAVFAVVGFVLSRGLSAVLPTGLATGLGWAVALGAWGAASTVNVRARLAEKRRFAADLAGGEAAVIEVEEAQVVQQGDGETVPLYYFVCGQQVLYLGGEDLFGLKPFPTRSLSVVQAPESRFLFRVEPRGPAVKPDRTIPRDAIDVYRFEACELMELDRPGLEPLREVS